MMNTIFKKIIFVIIIIISCYFSLTYFEDKRSKFVLQKRLNSIEKYKKNNTRNFKYKIPKQIIQCCPDKNNLSPLFQENIDYIKNLNPGWKYTLYDNFEQEKFISKYYPEYLEYYKAINPKYGAARTDFFRYIIIYDQGGVYLDLKSAMKHPLDDIIHPNDEFILSHWGLISPHEDKLKKYGEFEQWHIICIKKHPLMKQIINKIIDNIKCYDKNTVGVGKIGVLNTTGPIPYTKVILSELHRHNFTIFRSHTDIGLIYNNLKTSHTKVFGKSHYSNCKESIILDLDMDKKMLCTDTKIEQKPIDTTLELSCKNILEINNNNIIFYSPKDYSNYKVVEKKSIKDSTLEDFEDYYPIKCIMINCTHCINCLYDLINTNFGKMILENCSVIIVKHDNGTIRNILNKIDFVLTKEGHSYNFDNVLDIYTKVIKPNI